MLRFRKNDINSNEKNLSSSYGRMAIRNRFEDIAKILRRDFPVIVDGGANQGNMIKMFLQQYKNPTIFSFEPISDFVDTLNKRYGSMENVKIYQKALGSSNSTVTFNILNYPHSSSILKPKELIYKYHGDKMKISKRIDVEQVRLDNFIDVHEIDILKLDLQGYELEALKGAGKLLQNIKTITTEVEFVQLYENQPLFSDIDIYLRNHGFRLFNLYELWTQPDGQLTAGDAVYLNNSFF